MIILRIAVVLLIAACAPPIITGAGKDGITLKYDTVTKSKEEIQKLAEQHCAQYSLHAEFAGRTGGPAGLAPVYDRYDCK